MGQRRHPLPGLEWQFLASADGAAIGQYAVRRGLLIIRTLEGEEFIRDAGRDAATNEKLAALMLSRNDMTAPCYPMYSSPQRLNRRNE
jgi:hypothetical protein